MAGVHSHEVSMNPAMLQHSGSPSGDCRRMLLRLSLKGVVDAATLKDCNFLGLVMEIARLNLKYAHARC